MWSNKYAGYVWAYVSHFSLYGLAGLPFNRPPNVTDAYPSMEFLWPPNNKFVNVTIEGVTDPDGDKVAITIISITSDEPVALARGDKQIPDAYGLGTDAASLRAERAGTGNGRVYAIVFVASDGRGGEAIGTVKVCVPHNMQGDTYECIDDGQKYDATALTAYIWPSDDLGNPRNVFRPEETVYVTVPANGRKVSIYVVADRASWKNNAPLVDISDGAERLILSRGFGNQTIRVWTPALTTGIYDVVLDVDNDGVFDEDCDMVGSIFVFRFFVVPELPLGSITALLLAIAALMAFYNKRLVRLK